MKRVAIFGGTFDPVHLGHIELVKRARELIDLQQVLFMPCWQSPFKGRTVASGEERFEMLQIAIQEQEVGIWTEVSDYEITRPGPSYSWQTAQFFTEQYPDTEWFWILGTDQWKQIDQWAEPDKLRALLQFIVVTRNHEEVQTRDGWSHSPISFSHPASATKIRNDFAKYHHWLSPGVIDFCEKRKLYA
ncbi:MAG: nicotinate (nicotinamide) nucleotide adenylyltransferase [Verrucomicrobiales bacterium]|nr:nicotinate (nicotinamide) nucleotide adenylyltransferase [Verrucomicrobiales bacterium]